MVQGRNLNRVVTLIIAIGVAGFGYDQGTFFTRAPFSAALLNQTLQVGWLKQTQKKMHNREIDSPIVPHTNKR